MFSLSEVLSKFGTSNSSMVWYVSILDFNLHLFRRHSGLIMIVVPPEKQDIWCLALQWSYNERDGVSNHQPHDCLLNRLFKAQIKETSKLLVTDLYAGNSPVTGEFPAQMASNAENVSIWWRHHLVSKILLLSFLGVDVPDQTKQYLLMIR